MIREFFAQVPSYVDAETRDQAEAKLAEQARILRPDQLRRAANRILAYLNPDGNAPEVDRERKRSFTLGKQGTDLMTKGEFLRRPRTTRLPRSDVREIRETRRSKPARHRLHRRC
ncbi:DUF222 domain-containing protein [Antrihabitans sp. NCIMB 15449]|uniref:DUF222 domain-containing protein n=1 Tax=Antrihabitans spumae TaxID=3373370 RepID=A0ABW7JFM3_9NOCA